MATIQLLIGGSVLAPTISNKLKKQKDIAEATLKDNSVIIDRVLAARMRDATIKEMQRLARMDMLEFRQLMLWQGWNLTKFSDKELQSFINIETLKLQRLGVSLLQADFLKSETPIIISGNIKGAIGMVVKILGPTFVASRMPIGIAVWWKCDSDCKIETIHYSDKNVSQEIKP